MKKILAAITISCLLCTTCLFALAVDNGIISLSLNGVETKGIAYTIKEITMEETLLKVIVLHQANDDTVTPVDVQDYFNAAEQDEYNEGLNAWLKPGKRPVGSCVSYMKLLWSQENREILCMWRGTRQEGSIMVETFIFEDADSLNFDGAMIEMSLALFEKPVRESNASATLTFPLAGYDK